MRYIKLLLIFTILAVFNGCGNENENCKKGYRDRDGLCIIDINECYENSHNCLKSSKCVNMEGYFVCECPYGYSGDGVSSCKDINECITEDNNCSENANCINNEGSFSCECKDGFVGDGIICEGKPFIMTWDTRNSIYPFTKEVKIGIIIPNYGDYSYNYNIDCNNDGVFEGINITEDFICNYNSPGEYQIAILGKFPAIYLYQQNANLISIDQWGTIKWKSMSNAFDYHKDLTIVTTDSPDLSNVTDLSSMFSHTTFKEANINHWDVSNITNMMNMFHYSNFNGDISSWNVSNVKNMSNMFYADTVFDKDISNWDVSNVKNMSYMFYGADSFNQDLSVWNVNNVAYCEKFNKFAISWIESIPNFKNCEIE
ncbi:BspA family leucine-rich repeat surface protein [bacterium]|nr:BspA family leucine-rich repeat surface protein [bacterium]